MLENHQQSSLRKSQLQKAVDRGSFSEGLRKRNIHQPQAEMEYLWKPEMFNSHELVVGCVTRPAPCPPAELLVFTGTRVVRRSDLCSHCQHVASSRCTPWGSIHALITGPFDTPYEGGFFLFLFRCPPDYPIHPPRVKLMTTGNNTVRFNPNFYRNGKVCLSILGTWTGPAWSPAQSISSVLISIQSLMTENPYHNEPGFEQERHPGDSKNYNECIRHETIRVAVCDMLEGKCPCPEPLRGVMEKSFMEYYDFYEGVCKERLYLQGQTMQDPFGEKRGHFDYQSLLIRLQGIRQKVQEKHQQENTEIDSESSSSETETDTQGCSKA
uniref:Ubiquitin-conjugating enzyme E2 Z n=1 Tax=Apteryx owenii TaxID=8824 RepID=A0A8B9PLD3_APTOW